MTDANFDVLKTRIRDYMVKAVREAKVNSSWTNPDTVHEEALQEFIEAILPRSATDVFLNDFSTFQSKVAYFGMFNSLSQTLLKITSPGVPDFYQGTEIWDFSLVDPDNRRPVDFGVRRRMLRTLKRRVAKKGADRARLARGLLRQWRDGAIKLYVTFASLGYRKEHVSLFKDGEYMPLTIDGGLRENVCAFARFTGNEIAITVVPRFLTRLLGGASDVPLGRGPWGDTAVEIPDRVTANMYRNILTGGAISTVEGNGKKRLLLRDILADFPVALLENGR
jgi:(1->4)-alpha-D-glucan 1-alpha-D-glucosylmutase